MSLFFFLRFSLEFSIHPSCRCVQPVQRFWH
jgi:hypothetical protein